MLVRKIVGTWFLMDRSEADLALFDATRRWESLYDVETAEETRVSGRQHISD